MPKDEQDKPPPRRKMLLFDADGSTASIGGEQVQREYLGFASRPVLRGVSEVRDYMIKLLSFEKVKVPDDIFPNEYQLVDKVTFNEQAAGLGLNGWALDTLSVAAQQEKQQLHKQHKVRLLDERGRAIWGLFGDMILRFLSLILHSPGFVIVNSHTDFKESAIGTDMELPAVQGRARMEIQKVFDAIFYTEVVPGLDKEEPRYLWRTQPTAERSQVKIRVPPGIEIPFDVLIEQDFAPVLDFYEGLGIVPKILILGQSGTGKTRALTTINPR